MMRRLLPLTTLLALLVMTSALADNPTKPLSTSEPPKTEATVASSSRSRTVAVVEEELELLEAKCQAKKGYLKLAEIAVDIAQKKVAASNAVGAFGTGGS